MAPETNVFVRGTNYDRGRQIRNVVSHFNELIMRPSILEAQKIFGERPIVAAEIGVYRGGNARSIMSVLNVEFIYLIDPYVVFDEPSSRMGKTPDFPDNENVARETMAPWVNKCIWIRERSVDAVFPRGCSFDFVYVDGSHEHENVLADLRRYYPMIKPGGMLAGHDWRSPGVRAAVIKFSEEIRCPYFYKHPDWWINKPTYAKK